MLRHDSAFGCDLGSVAIYYDATGSSFRYEAIVVGEDEYGTRREVAWMSKYFSTKDAEPGIQHFLTMLADSMRAHT